MSAQTFNAQYVENVVTLAIEQAEATLTGIETSLGLTVSGASAPTPEQLAAFFFHQQQLYPPQAYAYPGTGMTCPTCNGTQQIATGPCPTCDQGQGPTGQVSHVVTASPWILALEGCENGKPWIDRFLRFTQKHAGSLTQEAG